MDRFDWDEIDRRVRSINDSLERTQGMLTGHAQVMVRELGAIQWIALAQFVVMIVALVRFW
jgi:hypothetical protein